MTHELFISIDTKRILAEDILDGKSKICLNKEREIRKTKAGGFAQKKYQNFVEDLKSNKKTKQWIIENLMKPGVLRFPYDEIHVEGKDEELRDSIQNFLLELNEKSNPG